nr:hypothetical protein [Rhodococcus opacus]
MPFVAAAVAAALRHNIIDCTDLSITKGLRESSGLFRELGPRVSRADPRVTDRLSVARSDARDRNPGRGCPRHHRRAERDVRADLPHRIPR